MFIKKATGTLEVHKNLQRAAHKNYVEKEIKKILGDLVYFYLINTEMDPHKLFFRKSKTKSLIIS